MRPNDDGSSKLFFFCWCFCRLPYFSYIRVSPPTTSAQLCARNNRNLEIPIPFPTNTQSPSSPPSYLPSSYPISTFSSSFIFIFIIPLLPVVPYDLNCRFELSFVLLLYLPVCVFVKEIKFNSAAHQSRSRLQSRDPCQTTQIRQPRRKNPISRSLCDKSSSSSSIAYRKHPSQNRLHRHYDGAHPSSNVCTSPWPSTSTGRR